MISSKSDVHRLLIASALAESETRIELDGWSEDIEATTNCLEALGARVKREKQAIVVTPLTHGKAQDAILDCGESGSTLRFLLPIVSALGSTSIITGAGRLPERPIGVLLDELKAHGSEFSKDTLPLTMSGQLRGGVYTLPGNVSSQFITGLLLALPMLKEDSEIRLTTAVESMGYIQMTLQTLKLFSIEIIETEQGYLIQGGQKYRSPKNIVADGDWSSAAFWLASGAMSGEITCTGLKMDSCQADKEIVSILKRFGAQVEEKGTSVVVRPAKLQGISIDASQIPDLVPILCTVAAQAEGVTEIYNAGRLRIKESDRLQAMAEGLTKLGVKIEEKPEGIVIHGGGEKLEAAESHLEAFNDHRIVMALAVAAMARRSVAILEGAQAVNKSYPSFFAHFVKLGGIADVL